jgi:tetratricopeptide (TPR) repeat protein
MPMVATPLLELYERAELHDERAALCERVAGECVEPSERAAWRVRLGTVLRETGRLREAAAAFRQALGDAPEDRDVPTDLCDVYRRLREHEPLARLLEAELLHVAGTDEIPLRLELAQILRARLDRPDEALGHLRRVLELEPGNRDALDAAIDLAVQLDRQEPIDALLAAALRTPSTSAVRAAWWSQRAALKAATGESPESAAAAYREALRLDPTRAADRAALRALLTAQRNWRAVLDCLDREIDAGLERAERLALKSIISMDEFAPDITQKIRPKKTAP